jgi:hypothetical protein
MPSVSLVTATIDERRVGDGKSVMLLRRHPDAPSLWLGKVRSGRQFYADKRQNGPASPVYCLARKGRLPA